MMSLMDDRSNGSARVVHWMYLCGFGEDQWDHKPENLHDPINKRIEQQKGRKIQEHSS